MMPEPPIAVWPVASGWAGEHIRSNVLVSI